MFINKLNRLNERRQGSVHARNRYVLIQHQPGITAKLLGNTPVSEAGNSVTPWCSIPHTGQWNTVNISSTKLLLLLLHGFTDTRRSADLSLRHATARNASVRAIKPMGRRMKKQAAGRQQVWSASRCEAAGKRNKAVARDDGS